MANQVEIFNIDFGDTIQSIEKLKAELKETRKLFEQAKPNTQDFEKYSAEVKRLDGTIKTLNGATKEQTNALGGINTAAKFATGSYGELKQQISLQTKALNQLTVGTDEFNATQEDLIKLQAQRIEVEKKIPSLFQERIKGAIDESNSLKQLKADLKAAQSAALNGDGKAAQKVAELKDKIDDLKDSTKSLQGSGVERLNTSMQLLTQGFADFDADKVKTGFKGIGAAMSAIPLILLIEGIKALIENFDVVVKFAKELTNSFSAAEKNVRELTKSSEENLIVNKNLIAAYDSQIALLTAQGASEKDIIELKKKKIQVQIAEAEDIVRLNSAKAAEILLNDSVSDSIQRVTISLMRKIGQDEAADKLEATINFSKKERIKEELKAIQDAQVGIQASKTALLVLDIEYNKKQVDNYKKANEERRKINEDNLKLSEQAYNESLAYIETQDKMYTEQQKQNEQAYIDSLEYLNEETKRLNNQRLIDDVADANTRLINVEMFGGNYLAAQLDLLNAEREQELLNTELTESQRAEITAKYRQQERQLKTDEIQRDLTSASNLTSSLGNLSNALYDVRRSNLEKGSQEEIDAAREQFDINKAFAIATTTINGAAGLINAFTLQPFYLAVAAAAGVALDTAAQIAVISSSKFQYFDGGYTEPGNPTDKSYSMGNKQFHKSEYVIPAKVLNTPEGSHLASRAESMRKGYSKSGISGYFDGGFTNRSASQSTNDNNNFTQQIGAIIANLPQQIVKVTDINNVNSGLSRAVQVSSL